MPHFGCVEDFQEATQWQFPPMRLTAPRETPFHAEAVNAVVDPMTVIRISASRTRLRRTPQLIGSGDEPYLKVILHRSGSLVAEQDGRRVQVGPGELFALDTSRPYELLGLDRCDIVVVGMPRAMAGPSGSLISRRTAIPLPTDRGIRSVIATFFSGLADEDAEIHGTHAVRLADAAASLVVTAFTDIPGERLETPTGLTERILSYALANLHDPGLSVTSVAKRFGISQRHLHTLMRSRDIRFSSWIRRERLKRIRQDLLDPSLANWTAAVIAARWGIQDPSHLSRSLRAEFGQSVAEIRER